MSERKFLSMGATDCLIKPILDIDLINAFERLEKVLNDRLNKVVNFETLTKKYYDNYSLYS